jgi:hypothetical protein
MVEWLAIPLMMVLNRASGVNDWFKGIGRNIYATAPLAGIGVGLLLGDVAAGLWAFISMALYRLPGWWDSLDMGVNEHTWYRDYAVMTLRTTFFCPILFYLSDNIWDAVFLTLMMANGASAMYLIGSLWYVWRRPKIAGWVQESGAGFFLGLGVGLAALY